MHATHAHRQCTAPHSGTNLPHISLPWKPYLREHRADGVVYYLERADGAVKIGCTKNYPARRVALVQRHGPLRLVTWESGYYELEDQRHAQFAHLRLDPIAEWFRVDGDLYDHILSLLAVL